MLPCKKKSKATITLIAFCDTVAESVRRLRAALSETPGLLVSPVLRWGSRGGPEEQFQSLHYECFRFPPAGYIHACRAFD